PPRLLHSFPTRRSSDLESWPRNGSTSDSCSSAWPRPTPISMARDSDAGAQWDQRRPRGLVLARPPPPLGRRGAADGARGDGDARSEEHTSELQSRFDLV